MSFKYKSKTNDFSFVKSLFAFCALVIVFNSNAQIVGGEISSEKEKKEKKEKEPSTSVDSLNGTNFYITGLFQYAYRDFEDQSDFGFHKNWENQTSSYNSGISIGLLMNLTEHFHLDIGVSYFGHGENYTFQDSLTDSSFTYKNNYMQVSLPIRLRYVYGEKFKFFAFGGLCPLNVLNIRYDSKYTQESGIEVVRELQVIKDGFSAFNLMLSAGVGFTYDLKYIGFTIYPEYRRHLLNTYSSKTVPMSHKMYGFGINAGMVFHF